MKSEQIVKAPPQFAPRSGFHLRGGVPGVQPGGDAPGMGGSF